MINVEKIKTKMSHIASVVRYLFVVVFIDFLVSRNKFKMFVKIPIKKTRNPPIPTM